MSLAGLALLLTTHAGSTFALFDDSASVSGSFAGETVKSHGQQICTNLNNGPLGAASGIRIQFSSTDARYRYAWNVRRLDGTSVAAGTIDASPSPGGTVNLDIPNPGSLLTVSQNLDVTVLAGLRGTTWTASSSVESRARTESLAGLAGALRCGYS